MDIVGFLWSNVYLIITILVVLLSILFWRSESDLDPIELRQRFALTVKLLEKHKGIGSWDDICTLNDLVVFNPKTFSFWCRPLYFRSRPKLHYLCLMIEDALTACQKSGPSSVFLFKNLIVLKSKNLMDPKKLDNYLNQTQLHLIFNIDNAWETVFEVSSNFKVTLETAEETCVPPISDLTGYLDPNDCIDTSKFLPAFKYQMETNLKRLEQMDPVPKSRSSLHLLVLVFSDPIVEKGLKLDGKKTLFHLELLDLQKKVSELLDMLQNHLVFCNGAFPDIQLDFFRNSKVFSYLIENREILQTFFSQPVETIQFPVSVLNVAQLQSTTVVLRNENDFKRVRGQYEQLLQINEKMTKMTPTIWPSQLPNLSTHNGLPSLRVAGVQDFHLILAAYAEYTKRLELLKKAWSISLRILYSTLEDTGHQ